MAPAPQPRVGLGVLVCKAGHVLVGRRRSSVGDGTYALPGGHLDFGETWEECAAREVEEETGLEIRNIKFASVNNSFMVDEHRPSHYVTIFMRADQVDSSEEPLNVEPEKCDGWQWVKWPHVPAPVFKPLQTLIDSRYDPFAQH